MNNNITKKITKILLSIFTLIIVVLFTIIVLPKTFINNSKQNTLQSDLKEELIENKGNYDNKKIVLQNTTKEIAKEIANRLNAKLRITEDGSFATVTLRNDDTILDVVTNEDNKDILKYISIDYKANISDIIDEEENEDETIFQINKPNYNITDPLYDKQTYLDYINLSNVWNYTKGSGVTVAVIDTGIDTDNKEFEGKISEYSYNATEDKIVKDYNNDWSLIEDTQGHGTAVTGVIAASMNNGIGITGIAPDVTIITIKAECDEKGQFKNSSDLVFGLYYAIERDVDVINMSFGGGSNIYSKATKLAVDSDIICVAAAGNDSTASLTYPAADENVIGVGALAEDSFELASYSNYGENVNIVAPGTVYTTLNTGEYGIMNGTSFSSPIVASIIALQISKEKYDSTYKEFTDKCELLYASSYDLGDKGCDFYFGYGAIDTSAFILEERKTVTFNYLTDEIEDTKQVFIKGHALQNIPEPTRNYAVFDGWYYDIHCFEEYNLYSDIWVNNITLYCSWVNEDDGVPYTYVELDDGTIEIRSYTGKRRYITIPDYIDGKEVSSIGREAFKNQTRLRIINLPNTLKTIKDNAFSNCINLTSITIPDNVESIGISAFSDNIRLYNVNFTSQSKLSKIGKYAFTNCSKLTRFDIPVNVTNITGYTFLGCTSLKQVNADKNSKYFYSIDGILYNKSRTTLLLFPSGKSGDTYDLLDTVTKLGDASFAYSNIKYINLKNTSIIGNGAFFVSKIEEVDLSNVLTIGESSFEYSNVSKVTLGKNLKTISAGAFGNTYYLNEITIPNNIVLIDKGAFSVSTLNKVTFEENSNLIAIEMFAFSNTNIIKLTLPDSVVSIGDYAFMYSSLQEITINDTSSLSSIGSYAFYNTPLEDITLPNSLVSIGGFAFGDTKLTSVDIPSSVTYMASSTFASCTLLTTINVSNDNNNYQDSNGVVYTKDLLTMYEYPAGRINSSYTILDNVIKVNEYAFYGSSYLNYIYLPSSLEELEQYCLSYVTNLREITIPDNVTRIGRYSFYEDLNLKTINISNNSHLSRLSYASFASCGITSFTIPSNVSTISQYVFTDCPYLTSIIFNDNSKLTSVSAYLFKGCSSLQTITFNKGSMLTNIEAHAFEGMDKLTSINFNDAKITNIDNFSFRYCSSLKSITIPEGVEEIGRYAFYGCSSLNEITLPESINYIGRYAFNLTNEINIYFTSSILPLNLQENWDYGIGGYYVGVVNVYDEGDFKLANLKNNTISIIKYNGTDSILDLKDKNISQIGGNAFNRSTIKEITLPLSLQTIEKNAFSNSKLERITIPSSVIQINDYAFYNTSISEVNIPTDSNLQKIGMYAFSKCNNLKEIYIPSKVEKILSYAFLESGIEKVIFSEEIKITEFNEGVFQKTKLNKIDIPESITLLNNSCFRDIETLKEVNFNQTQSIKIMSYAFYNTGLESLFIPKNIEYIGEYAFVGLESLTSLEVDNNNKYYKSVDNVLFTKDLKKLIAYPAGIDGKYIIPSYVEVIGFGAFENTKLEQIEFEKGINLLTLGYRAFYNAQNLKEITIPESVVSIDYYAFALCKSLTTVKFSDNSKLNGIYEGAFYGCIRLNDITLPNEIYEISDYAFYGCLQLDRIPVSEESEILGIYNYSFSHTGIKELITPDSLLDIGDYAFSGTQIKKAEIKTTKQDQLIIGLGVFNECESLEEITIPFIGASLDDTDLGYFAYIFGAGNYTAGSTYVPSSLKKVIIDEGQTILVEGAFYELKDIEEIEMPSSIKYLGYNCMKDTTAKYSLLGGVEPLSGYWYDKNTIYEGMIGKGIEEIVISENVKIIWWNVFKDCTSLTSITIPESVTGIGNYAFSGCTSLTNITIPSSITSIGGLAFWDCSSLINVFHEGTIEDWCNINMSSNPMEYAKHFYMRNENNEWEEVTKIIISDTITEISDSRFKNFTALTSITIPSSVTSIGNDAFYNCTSIINITFEEGSQLTSIGWQAFYNCTSLINITFEKASKLTSIERSAFYNCASLTSIIIPSSITSIGDNAFCNCTSLTNITIPSSVTSIGRSAFNGCTSLISVTFEEGSQLISIEIFAFYHCISLMNVYYEGTIEGWCNIEFDEHSSNPMEYATHFYMRDEKKWKEVIEIVIPDTIKKIGDKQFYEFSNIKSIVIPNSVTSIGSSAFSGCTSLTNITIPSSVINIGNYAFSGCYNLREIINDSNLVFIPGSSDYGLIAFCALKVNNNGNIIYKDGVETYEYFIDGDFKFLNYNNSYYLISYLGASERPVIPYTVNGKTYSLKYIDETLKDIELSSEYTSIASSMFSNNKILESIIIPSSVKSIEYSAFSYCPSLTNVIFEEVSNLISIKEKAFENCSSLTNITIPSSVTSIGSNTFEGCNFETFIIDDNNKSFVYIDGIIYDKDIESIIYVMNNVVDVVIPSGVISIGDFAFNGCTLLTNITIPNSVTSIGGWAFNCCTSLTNITIPNSVTSIGGWAFNCCTSLTNVNYEGTIENWCNIGFDWYSNPMEYAIHLYMINEYNEWEEITKILIPETITEIGSNQFFGFSETTNITIPSSVISIGNYAFSGCTSLTNITIPSSVTSIGDFAFNYCTSLTNITIPSSVTSIEGSAFNYCTSLTNITIPSSVTSIGDFAFSGCTSLINITIPSSVTSIGSSAFYNCTSLTSITIPSGVTSIESSAFYNCYSLIKVYYEGTIEDWCNIKFVDSNSNPMYYAKQFYMRNENDEWKEVTEIIIPDTITEISHYRFYNFTALTNITIPSSVTSIGSSAFSVCTSLTNITIPDSVTSIGNSAFNYCTLLTNITIPSSVTSIGDFAFSGCTSLTNITIPSSVTSIGDSAFNYCTSLTNITIPSSVTSIENSAFIGCTSLTSIEIPSSVTSIGSAAFSGCASLTNITIPSSVTSIGDDAFFVCWNLREITNYSNLEFAPGSSDYGYIAFYAWMVNNNGNIIYKDGYDNYIIQGDFKFLNYDNNYYLISYLGTSERPIIPYLINGKTYSLEYIDKTLKDIELSSEYISIPNYMFNGNSILESIIIPSSVTSIEHCAFENCASLTNITIPNSVTSIENYAFYSCTSLTNITFKEGSKLISIGENAFYNTGYYNDESNWNDGFLYLDNILLAANKDIEEYYLPDNVRLIAGGAFTSCYKLKYVEVIGNTDYIFEDCTNIETIVFKNLNNSIKSYFYSESIPITLKNVVLLENCDIRNSYIFSGITGVNIYVDRDENDVMWDNDYKGWNNNNQVYYKGKWINAKFIDTDNKTISNEFYLTSQIIKQPIIRDVIDNGVLTQLIGWDINDDGIVDTIPATSNISIIAKAIYNTSPYKYKVNYYDVDNKTIITTQYYDYNDTLQLLSAPSKKGYTFINWTNYPTNLKVVEDINIYSKWTHNGGGHNYNETIVDPTCTDKGYTLHKCSICDESYKDNYINETGHKYLEWIIDITSSCEIEGLKHRICQACQYEEFETISKEGHDYISQIINVSTCVEKGKEKYQCSKCNDAYEEEIELKEHNYEKVYVSKSLLQKLIEYVLNIFFGYEGDKGYYYQCKECKQIMTSTESSTKTASVQGVCEHKTCEYITIIEPTCIDDRYEQYKCSNCNKVFNTRQVDKTGIHNYSEWKVVNEPTNTKDGLKERECLVCKTKETKTIPNLLHKHSYEETVIKPTCISQGYTIYTCKCGDTYNDTYVSALNHINNVHHEKVNATCEEQGIIEYWSCPDCNKFFSDEECLTEVTDLSIKELGHTEVILPKVDATCTTTGLTDGKKCSVCEEILVKQEVIKALGHTEVILPKIEATCTKTGLTEGSKCSVCGEILVKQEEIKAEGHTEVILPKVDATCTTTGLTEGKKCSVCEEVLVKQEEIKAKGHTEVILPKVDATCTTSGLTEGKKCSVCEEVLVKQEEIKAKGHTEVILPKVDATCTTSGLTIGKKCSVCEEVLVKQTEIKSLGHSYSEWKVVKEATEEETGLKEKVCSRCNDKQTEIIQKLSHTHKYTDSIINPTCVDKGYTLHTCKCGDSYKDNYKDALGHTEVILPKVEATCTNTGLTEGKKCSVCEEVLVKQDVIKAKGHIEVILPKVDATCTTSGLTEGKKCSVCEEVLVKQTEIKAKGHTKVILPKVEVTCTEDGLTEGKKCSVCEEVLVKQTEIKALGHSYSEWKVVKEATEEEAGLKEKECSRCNDKQTEIIPELTHTHNYNKTNYNDEYHWKECECKDISNKTLHTYDEGTKVDNEIIYKCTICGNIKTEPIETNNNTVTVIIIISVSTVILSSLGILFIIKKKRR